MYANFLRLRISFHPVTKAEFALILIEKFTVPIEYLDFADIFLEKWVNVLLERTRANELLIELEEGKQPPYGFIYSLKPVEIETFKTYIETSLVNKFI